jgi:hypothetical protein
MWEETDILFAQRTIARRIRFQGPWAESTPELFLNPAQDATATSRPNENDQASEQDKDSWKQG